MTFRLVKPSLEALPEYKAALERGWSPDTMRKAAAIGVELEKIAADPAAFVEALDDPEAKGAPITLPDGSTAPRLPGFRRWMWDGAFCGSIGFPLAARNADAAAACARPHRLCGRAVEARLRLRHARPGADADRGPAHRAAVRPGHDRPRHAASQAVIRANGGRLVEQFRKAALFGGKEALRFHIDLGNQAAPITAPALQEDD